MTKFDAPADAGQPSVRRQVLGGLSAQSATFVLSATLGTITTVVLARSLGPEGFGGFNFLFAFIYFFQSANDLGISTSLVRELAQAPERTREIVSRALGLKLVLSLLSLIVAWAAAAWWPGLSADVRVSVAVFALILPIQAMGLPIVTLQARVMIARSAWVEVVNRVVGFACMMTAAAMHLGLIAMTMSLVAGELAALVVTLTLTRGFAVPVPAFDVEPWRALLRASIPLGLAGLLVSLVNRFDFLLLQLMAVNGMDEVGFYGTAYRVTSVFEKVPLFAMATLFPIMSRLAADDPRALAALYHRVLRKFALLAVPMVTVVLLLAPLAVRLLAGPEYEAAVTPLRILIWSTGVLYPAIVAGNLLIAVNRASQSLRAWAIAAPLNIVLNLVLIPRYGASGAAVATVACFALVFAVSMVMAHRALRDAVAFQERLAAQPLPAVSSRVH